MPGFARASAVALALGLAFAPGLSPARAADPAAPDGSQSTASGKGDRGEVAGEGHVSRTVTLTLDIAGHDEALESAVRSASSLARLSEDGTSSPDAILRATLSERRRLTGIMFQQARYAAIVEVTVAGVSSEDAAVRDAIEAAFRRGNVPATIRIRPGPVFHVGRVAVVLADGRPATVVGPAETGLVAGAVAGQASIVDAEGRLLQVMRKAGYPLAGVTGRNVIADHATSLIDVTYTVDPGRQASFGAVEVRGTEKMRPDLIRQWAPFRAGERYNPAALEEYARYLRSLGVFNSVRVVTGDAVAADGTIPVIVDVSERKRRYIGASASFATTDGAVLTAYWGHRNLFGGGERIRIEATTSRLGVNAINDLEYSLGYTFVK
ncbi:POTRA domain-containing protein, partial [Pseudoxanthobacter sp.]|uniref:autotransporter assembly complex protein TamA n=1 Tax=Pseudoxanthobacter sp. TaxID=1925742 RepID=UPI002FDF7303